MIKRKIFSLMDSIGIPPFLRREAPQRVLKSCLDEIKKCANITMEAPSETFISCNACFLRDPYLRVFLFPQIRIGHKTMSDKETTGIIFKTIISIPSSPHE